MPTLGMSAAFATTDLLGSRLDPYLACNFLVEIEGLLVGGFSEVTGLECEVEYEEIEEGGVNDYTHKLPTRTKYSQNLVLKHGLTDIDTLWAWHHEITQGEITRRNGSIYLLDRQQRPAMWWNFKGAYPVKWEGPELRADAGEVAVETVELVHQGIVKPRLSRMLSAARLAVSIVSQ